MQVDPIKPKLKPPGTKLLKLEYHGLLSNVASKFNLRRYTEGLLRNESARATDEIQARGVVENKHTTDVGSPPPPPPPPRVSMFIHPEGKPCGHVRSRLE